MPTSDYEEIWVDELGVMTTCRPYEDYVRFVRGDVYDDVVAELRKLKEKTDAYQ